MIPLNNLRKYINHLKKVLLVKLSRIKFTPLIAFAIFLIPSILLTCYLYVKGYLHAGAVEEITKISTLPQEEVPLPTNVEVPVEAVDTTTTNVESTPKEAQTPWWEESSSNSWETEVPKTKEVRDMGTQTPQAYDPYDSEGGQVHEGEVYSKRTGSMTSTKDKETNTPNLLSSLSSLFKLNRFMAPKQAPQGVPQEEAPVEEPAPQQEPQEEPDLSTASDQEEDPVNQNKESEASPSSSTPQTQEENVAKKLRHRNFKGRRTNARVTQEEATQTQEDVPQDEPIPQTQTQEEFPQEVPYATYGRRDAPQANREPNRKETIRPVIQPQEEFPQEPVPQPQMQEEAPVEEPNPQEEHQPQEEADDIKAEFYGKLREWGANMSRNTLEEVKSLSEKYKQAFPEKENILNERMQIWEDKQKEVDDNQLRADFKNKVDTWQANKSRTNFEELKTVSEKYNQAFPGRADRVNTKMNAWEKEQKKHDREAKKKKDPKDSKK